MTRALVSIGTLAFIACSSPTDQLTVASTGTQSLRLANKTAEPIYYFAVESDAAAIIDWVACTDPAQCKHVAPHGVSAIPYDQIAGYTPAARQAIVYWWHLRPDGSLFRPDSIRSLGAQL